MKLVWALFVFISTVKVLNGYDCYKKERAEYADRPWVLSLYAVSVLIIGIALPNGFIIDE